MGRRVSAGAHRLPSDRALDRVEQGRCQGQVHHRRLVQQQRVGGERALRFSMGWGRVFGGYSASSVKAPPVFPKTPRPRLGAREVRCMGTGAQADAHFGHRCMPPPGPAPRQSCWHRCRGQRRQGRGCCRRRRRRSHHPPCRSCLCTPAALRGDGAQVRAFAKGAGIVQEYALGALLQPSRATRFAGRPPAPVYGHRLHPRQPHNLGEPACCAPGRCTHHHLQ